jgi:hypothetical protein
MNLGSPKGMLNGWGVRLSSRAPFRAKLTNFALAEDASVLSGVLSPGDSATDGGFWRRILAAMLALDPGPPGSVMMNDVDFARHVTHSFETQICLPALEGIAPLEFGDGC